MADTTTKGQAISRGMRDAALAGQRIGRPRAGKDEQIADLLRAGWGAERVRRHLKVGTTAIQRVRRFLRGVP